MRVKDNSRCPLSADEKKIFIPGLEKISGKKIKDLLSENPGLLVFPQSFEKSEDKPGNNVIFTLEKANSEICTGNIMGFIGNGTAQLEICSRFESEDGNDFFLHYLLQKVFALNLFSWKHESKQDSALDILTLLFPHFLKRALRQGIYKEYRSREHNDANIRGSIDFARHIRTNIPFAGKIAYRAREHDSENDLLHLVRHTIERLRESQEFSAQLYFDDETTSAVSKIVAVTPSFKPTERERIIAKNLRPHVHPFFSEYEALQKICVQILRHDSLRYGSANDSIFGILFDGAWLWEEYLSTLPALKDFSHSKNKTGENGIRFFQRGKRCYFPDFFNEYCVLDAKYKDKESVSDRDDLFQIISYLHVLNVTKGGFISPRTGNVFDWEKTRRELEGFGGKLTLFHLEIPQCAASYAEFCREIKINENKLSEKIRQFLEA